MRIFFDLIILIGAIYCWAKGIEIKQYLFVVAWVYILLIHIEDSVIDYFYGEEE